MDKMPYIIRYDESMKDLLVSRAEGGNFFALISGMPEELYHASPGLAQSRFKKMGQTPAHFAFHGDYPVEPTAAMKLGSALHCAVLEPRIFAERYAVMPNIDKRTNAGKQMWVDWMTENPNRIGIKPEEMEQVRGMAASLDARMTERNLLGSAAKEVSAYWWNDAYGVQCRGRLDALDLERGVILDIKTTDDASEGSFERTLWNFKYHWQLAFYRQGVEAITGVSINHVTIAAIERDPPYACQTFRLMDDVMKRADVEVNDLFSKYRQCLDAGSFPGYPDEIVDLKLPRWA